MQSLASTTAGKVEGRVENGIHVFRGIPFAEPPVGSLRLRRRSPGNPGPACSTPRASDPGRTRT